MEVIVNGEKVLVENYSLTESSISLTLDGKIYAFAEEDLNARAFERGEVDAITMRNPYLMVAQKRLKEHIVEFSDNDIYRQYFFLIIKQQLMKRKNALESFMSALVEAEKFLYSRPNEALNLVENNFGPERNIEIRNDWEEYQFELLLGGGMLLSLEYELDWYYNKIGKRKESQINFLDFIETDVLMRLKPFSISVRK